MRYVRQEVAQGTVRVAHLAGHLVEGVAQAHDLLAAVDWQLLVVSTPRHLLQATVISRSGW